MVATPVLVYSLAAVVFAALLASGGGLWFAERRARGQRLRSAIASSAPRGQSGGLRGAQS